MRWYFRAERFACEPEAGRMASIPVGRSVGANHVRKNGGVGCDSKLTGHPTPSYITQGVTFIDPAPQERVKRGLLQKHARTYQNTRERRPSPGIKDDARDNEHRCHRHHLRHHPRKRLRCRPFGGFLHAILPRPGHESSLPAKASIAQMFLLGTPLDDIRLDDSPVTEYRQC